MDAGNIKNSPIYFGHGHIGASKKRDYEDRHFAQNITTQGGLQATLLIVADGVGGGNLGQRAAQLTVDSIVEECKKSTTSNVLEMLGKAIGRANRIVYEEAGGDREKDEMSATASVAVIVNKKLYIANVGDSRIYLIRDKQAKQISLDHTWATEKVRAGKLTRQEAEKHPNAGFLARSVGYEATVLVDLGLYTQGGNETSSVALQQQGLDLRPNDVILLCSDGLIKTTHTGKGVYVSPEEIVSVISNGNAEQAAKTLVDLAVGRNVDDNVTAVVATMPGRKMPLMRRHNYLVGGGIGLALVLMVAVFLGIQLITASQELGKIQILNSPPEGVNLIFGNPTLKDQPIAKGYVFRGEDTGGALQTSDKIAVVTRALTSEDGKLVTNYVLGKNSTLILNLAPWKLDLTKGWLYLRTNLSGNGSTVMLSAREKSTVTVEKVDDQDGRAIIEVDSSGNVMLYCFTGICRYNYPGSAPLSYEVTAGMKHLFRLRKDPLGPEGPYSAFNIVDWEKFAGDCSGYCLDDISSLKPVPGATATLMPTATLAPSATQTSTPEPTKTRVPPTPTYTPEPKKVEPTATVAKPTKAPPPPQDTPVPTANNDAPAPPPP